MKAISAGTSASMNIMLFSNSVGSQSEGVLDAGELPQSTYANYQGSASGLAEESFEELFERYEQKIFNLILRLVGNYEDAVDLTSETFVQALKGLPNFRRQSQPYTWLYRIAVNLCKNYFRRNSHRSRFLAFSLDQKQGNGGQEIEVEIEDSSQEPGRLFETSELQHQVGQAILTLPEDMRTAVLLREMQGMSYQEIADVMDCSMEAVKSRLFRARAALKKELQPYIDASDSE